MGSLLSRRGKHSEVTSKSKNSIDKSVPTSPSTSSTKVGKDETTLIRLTTEDDSPGVLLGCDAPDDESPPQKTIKTEENIKIISPISSASPRSIFGMLARSKSKDSASPADEGRPPIPGTSAIALALLPHKHTLFCERKERVCTAVGKIQELETIRASSSDSREVVKDFAWLRSSRGADDPASFQEIPGATRRSLDYQLTAADVDHYISFRWNRGTEVVYASQALGPVLPGPPRLLDLVIVGDFRSGHVLRAQGNYIGGMEGESEYWWMRIREGVRETLSEPRPRSTRVDDPSLYRLTDLDVGCVLKVKCRPVRADGWKGEIFTSKASPVVRSSEVAL